jgi:PilZ domain
MKARQEVVVSRRSLRRWEQRALRRLMPRKLLVLTAQGGEPQPTYGIVNDISDSGAGIVADRLLPAGRDVRLRICFYPQVCFDTKAHVVWGKDGMKAAEGVLGLALNGLRFAGPLDLKRMAGSQAQEPDPGDPPMAGILEYLEYQIPDYPFNRTLDRAFVAELISDFPTLDILEEIKTFRWYYDSDPVARVANPRASLRRWIASSYTTRLLSMPKNGNGNGHGLPSPGNANIETGLRSWVSFLKS